MHPSFSPRLPTVVLLHASAGSKRQWQDLADLLRGRFAVHAIDLHGHGSRPDWNGDRPMTLADEAALLEPILAEADAVHLVGHSYGAAVAIEAARRYPDQVASLVAYEPVLFRLLMDDPRELSASARLVGTFAQIRQRLAAGDAEAAGRRFVDFWSGEGAWDALPEAHRAPIAARMASVQRQAEALMRHPAREIGLESLAVPMLMMSGVRTVEAGRRIGALLREALPQAAHEALPHMGHMGPVTHARTINTRIERFLRTTIGVQERVRWQASGRPTAPMVAALARLAA